MFWNKSMETCVDIEPPDPKSELGPMSGFINLEVKFMTALKYDTF